MFRETFGGLATATASDRKKILKNALNVSIYAKLEDLAKKKAVEINKAIIKTETELSSLSHIEDSEIENNENIISLTSSLETKNLIINELKSKLNKNKEELLECQGIIKTLEGNISSARQSILNINSKISETTLKKQEYSNKHSGLLKEAKVLVAQIDSNKSRFEELSKLDFNKIELNSKEIELLNESLITNNSNLQRLMIGAEECKVPLPKDNFCKHCRQELLEEDRAKHQLEIDSRLKEINKEILEIKSNITEINNKLKEYKSENSILESSKREFGILESKISNDKDLLGDKKSHHKELTQLIASISEDLVKLNEELNNNTALLDKDALDKIVEYKKQLSNLIQEEGILLDNLKNKEKDHLQSVGLLAVCEEKKNKYIRLKDKKKELALELSKLNADYKIHELVIESFSGTGIPNVIIQNVLGGLQIEANELLQQLKPGLQLSFIVEKTIKKSGEQEDTLDIKYTINGRDRDYSQLSGAMKLAVKFSLKLGLSFLIQKITQSKLEFLLLDEVDQALDRSSSDAFIDIIKYFHNDLTIMAITHNDRLKDKFNNMIVVEQDKNMVSNVSQC